MNEGGARSALGFAMKAGRVASGDFAAEKALKTGRARLIVIDSAASENTKKHWRDTCSYRGTPLVTVRDMGAAIGKPQKMVAAVTDEAFSAMLLKNCSENDAHNHGGGEQCQNPNY